MSIDIWWDNKALEKVLQGSGIEHLERETMEQKLSEIRGQFITDFGTEGEFEIVSKAAQSTKYGTSRLKFMIIPASAKTRAILKRHPGWLAKFVQ